MDLIHLTRYDTVKQMLNHIQDDAVKNLAPQQACRVQKVHLQLNYHMQADIRGGKTI